MLHDMSEADRQWLRMEMRSALRPVMEELKVVREELMKLNKFLKCDKGKSRSFAYAFANTQVGTADEQDQAARRAEATTLYDGAAVEKEETSGSDEVVGSGKAD